MLVSEVAALVEAAVPALASRVAGAAELSELVRQKAWPQASPFAFVLPLGLRPLSAGDAISGAFVQTVAETFGVVLFVRAAGDITGARALPAIDELVWDVVNGLSGEAPAGAAGIFHLTRGGLLSAEAGAVIYQLDFSIESQVRILA